MQSKWRVSKRIKCILSVQYLSVIRDTKRNVVLIKNHQTMICQMICDTSRKTSPEEYQIWHRPVALVPRESLLGPLLSLRGLVKPIL